MSSGLFYWKHIKNIASFELKKQNAIEEDVKQKIWLAHFINPYSMFVVQISIKAMNKNIEQQ